MAAATWQQANGAKKCENGRRKTVRNRQPKKCENERKSTKTIDNKRKQAKKCENDRGVFFVIVFWPFSSGHITVAM